LKLSHILQFSKDREVSLDFSAKLMVNILQQERENIVTQVMLGTQIGWIMGMTSASQSRISNKTKDAYTYKDYINKGKPHRVVGYDVSTSKYIELTDKEK
jgi:hypothetical protein